MTVYQIKNCFSEFKLKPKINVSDDYEVSISEIVNGTIFQHFVMKDGLSGIVNGLDLIDGDICYVYSKLNNIEIETDSNFPPCGGKNKLDVAAYYDIISKSTRGEIKILERGKKSYVTISSSLLKTDNMLFKYDRPYLVNNTSNTSDDIIEVNIKASYYYNGEKFEANKKVTQTINTNSSWLIEKEPTQEIFITLSETEVSKNGGIVSVNVERLFSRLYYMKDSCGNIVGGKNEPGLIEDISKKCFITSSNNEYFKINKNTIIVAKQPIGGEKRETIITAHYLDKTASVTLYQQEGGKVTNEYELSFSGGSKTSIMETETSLPCQKEIKLVSNEIIYVDGEYSKTIFCPNLNVESDQDWIHSSVVEKDDGVYLLIDITKPNLDKINDREATLTISNVNSLETFIVLIVSQNALSVTDEKYDCEFYGDGEYDSKELDNAKIFFHPIKKLIFENGEEEIEEIETNIRIKYLIHSDDERLLTVKRISKNDNIYNVLLNNFTSHSIKNVTLSLKIFYYSINNEKLFESEIYKISTKKNDVIDYAYELCFDEKHNKFKTLSWNGSIEPKIIVVNSWKHKLKNGIYDSKENIPFRISLLEKNGKELSNNDFSVKINEDNTVTVFPVNVETNTENVYTITQKESNEKIQFKLSSIKSDNKIPLKVIVYCKNVGNDIWTGEDGHLIIDNKDKIKLSPCWLSPNMKENTDIAFDGYVTLENGVHTFETENVICIEYNTKTKRDCNIFNTMEITDRTKEIRLYIKV